MKNSVYLEEQEVEQDSVLTLFKKPIVIVLAVSVVLILLLNLISTFIFY